MSYKKESLTWDLDNYLKAHPKYFDDYDVSPDDMLPYGWREDLYYDFFVNGYSYAETQAEAKEWLTSVSGNDYTEIVISYIKNKLRDNPDLIDDMDFSDLVGVVAMHISLVGEEILRYYVPDLPDPSETDTVKRRTSR
jgi:hypothetical protein